MTVIKPGTQVSWLWQHKRGRAMTGIVLDEPQIGGACIRVTATESRGDFSKIGQRYWVPRDMLSVVEAA